MARGTVSRKTGPELSSTVGCPGSVAENRLVWELPPSGVTVLYVGLSCESNGDREEDAFYNSDNTPNK